MRGEYEVVVGARLRVDLELWVHREQEALAVAVVMFVHSPSVPREGAKDRALAVEDEEHRGPHTLASIVRGAQRAAVLLGRVEQGPVADADARRLGFGLGLG